MSTPAERAAHAAYMREWRLRPENHERVKASQRERYRRNRDANTARNRERYWANPERAREAAAKWQRDNLERANERKRQWAAANREKVRAASRAWYRRNKQVSPTWAADHAAARRARAAGGGSFLVTERDRRRILATGCVYCGAEATEMDHVIPVARGGRHSIGNLVGACMRCNRSKNRRLIVEWRLSQRAA